jgi:hypothetical protein
MARRIRKINHSRKYKKGGSNSPNPSTYSSATTYGMAVNGTGNSQYNRVFENSSPDAQFPSNRIVGVQGQNLGYSPTNVQKAGKRTKKGGFWSQIVNQALVPFSILGMQQTYRRKKHGGSKSRKNHKY